ncbi:MAG: hypothetical protein AVDCRST_MAG76-421 [uncultured Acidimicrobiales bacterium]|uniref:SUKH-4 immunity protein of toxin-antitoxin system n=1 Tax=uncultured Acidimicrobiales bacterium TaxID=310071 RepID=A0A6J4H970_9ACTN|nr:MAG: hypothetical protein AVDCRST_MAG76-421 [uncultured Acidimicrobiales bacterium]
MPKTLPPFFWPIGTGAEPTSPPPAGRQVLGHDGTAYFVVLADGSVASVDPLNALSTRFVNSSPHQLFGCLEALAERTAQLERSRHDEAVIAVSELRHDLNRFDIAALGDRDNWWAVVLDHLEDSLP